MNRKYTRYGKVSTTGRVLATLITAFGVLTVGAVWIPALVPVVNFTSISLISVGVSLLFVHAAHVAITGRELDWTSFKGKTNE